MDFFFAQFIRYENVKQFKNYLDPDAWHWLQEQQENHTLPSGFQKFLVHNVKEPEVLLMCNKSYSADIDHNVSSKNQKAVVERAAQWAIRVTHPNARLCSD